MPGLANWVDSQRSGGRAGLDGEIMDSTLVMYSLSCYSQAKGSFPNRQLEIIFLMLRK